MNERAAAYLDFIAVLFLPALYELAEDARKTFLKRAQTHICAQTARTTGTALDKERAEKRLQGWRRGVDFNLKKQSPSEDGWLGHYVQNLNGRLRQEHWIR